MKRTSTVVPRVRITIEADPYAQPRHPDRGQGRGRYLPTEAKRYRRLVELLATVAMRRRDLLTGPIGCHLVAIFKRPARHHGQPLPPHRIRRDTRPFDFDNVAKAVTDAVEGIIFMNDGQIAHATIERWFAAIDEPPHVQCIFEELPPT